MKLKQDLNGCYLECFIGETLERDQSIFLVLPTNISDEEKTKTVAKVTDKLVSRDWSIVDTQQLDNAVALEFTQCCEVLRVIEDMLACA